MYTDGCLENHTSDGVKRFRYGQICAHLSGDPGLLTGDIQKWVIFNGYKQIKSKLTGPIVLDILRDYANGKRYKYQIFLKYVNFGETYRS